MYDKHVLEERKNYSKSLSFLVLGMTLKMLVDENYDPTSELIDFASEACDEIGRLQDLVYGKSEEL